MTISAAERAFFGEETVDLSVPPMLPPSVAKLVARNPDIQTLNAVAIKLVNVLDDPNSSAVTVERALQADVGLATRILRTARSSFYGGGATVSSVRQAVARIGFESVRAIALAAAMADDNRLSSPMGEVLAKHSIAVGVAARLLAYHQKTADADLCFVAGLLHDVGKFAFLQAAPERYEPLARTVSLAGWHFTEAETAIFGCDHADLGASLAYGWGLHPRILMAIRLHHQLGTVYASELDPLTATIVATVRLADDMFRTHLQVDGSLTDTYQSVQSEARDVLGLPDTILEQVWSDFHTHFHEACLVLL